MMKRTNHRETLGERGLLDHGRSVVGRTLPGGLRLFVKRYAAAPVVTVWAWVGVGSVDELPEEAGLSHVLEHMAFKGTRRRGLGEISRVIESHGGVINAFTSYYSTAYYVSLPRRHLELAIDLLGDVLCDSVYDAGELERELAVIGEEIRMRDDHPQSRLWELVTSSVFRRHPLGRPIAGYHETVQTFTRSQLLHYLRRHYTAANTRLAVVGDVDPETVIPLVERHFAGYDRPGGASTEPISEPRQSGFRLLVEEMPLARARLALAWPTVPQLHGDAPALDVLANILGGGRSSRLHRRLKDERELIDSVDVSSYTGNDTGLFVIETELGPDDIPAALAAVNGEIELLRTELVGPYEVGRVLNGVELEYLESRETAEGQAHEICHFDQLGDRRLADEYLDNLYAVDAPRLREVALCHLIPEALNVCLLVPEGRGADFERLEPVLEASTPPTRRRPLPESPPWVCVPGPVTVEESRLANGLQVILRPNANVAQAALTVLARGGVIEETDGGLGITNLALELLPRGSLRRGAEEFHSQLEYYGAELDTFLRRDFFGLRLSCASRHLEACLSLFCEAFAEPAFPAASLPAVRREALNRIAARSEDAVGYSLGRANNALYGGTGYGRFLSGETNDVAALGRDETAAWYNRRLCGRRLVFGVAGGFERDALLDLLEGLTLDICPGEEPSLAPSSYASPHVEERLPKQQTHIALAFPAPDRRAPDRFAALVLAHALSGAGSRLFVNLRDVRHLAYMVFFSYRPRLAGGAFFAYLATSPGRGDEALGALREELERVVRDGLDPGEVEDAKGHLAGLFELGHQRNAAVLASYCEALATGRGVDDVEAFPRRIQAVTAEEVAAVAARYLGGHQPATYLLRGTLPRRDSLPR